METGKRIGLFTNEYPPHVYGGAGVHVQYLSEALARLAPVEVRCFGSQDRDEGNLRVRGVPGWADLVRNAREKTAAPLDAFARDLGMAADCGDLRLIHCHTWYTFMAGFLARMLWRLPLVVTAHSLEPLRPWKAEQLGTGFLLSGWMEKTGMEAADAVVAVSGQMRQDILRHFRIEPERVHVIHNGIDPSIYRWTDLRDALDRYQVDPARPYVLFVGRISRQKGIVHLLRAAPLLDPALQLVLCAGAPDTPDLAREVEERVAALRASRGGVIWVPEMVPRDDVIQLYSHAAVFCCPSVYEPFGIINLEAMACGTAVVASSVGGIPEVVEDGVTGVLVDPGAAVDFGAGSAASAGAPAAAAAETFAHGLAAALNRVALDPALREEMGRRGRDRVERLFTWDAIAERTLALYNQIAEHAGSERTAPEHAAPGHAAPEDAANEPERTA